MQRTIRARMLNKLIYLLNNTDIEGLEYEAKRQKIKSKYTLLFTVLCEQVVDIYNGSYRHNVHPWDEQKRAAMKKQLEEDYDTFLKHSEQFVTDEFLI